MWITNSRYDQRSYEAGLESGCTVNVRRGKRKFSEWQNVCAMYSSHVAILRSLLHDYIQEKKNIHIMVIANHASKMRTNIYALWW